MMQMMQSLFARHDPRKVCLQPVRSVFASPPLLSVCAVHQDGSSGRGELWAHVLLAPGYWLGGGAVPCQRAKPVQVQTGGMWP